MEWGRDEVMVHTGWDVKNAHVAMSILKNPKKTKTPLVTVYDRKRKVFTLVEAQEGTTANVAG